MKYFAFAIIPVLIAGAVLLAIDPSKLMNWLDTGMQSVEAKIESVVQDKEVRFKGLDVLSEAELKKLLPLELSTIWWNTNTAQIGGALRANPFVADARVAKCEKSESLQFGCFEISITERVPAFIALVDETPWLVGEDGGFLGPLPGKRNVKELVEELSPRIGRLRVLRGVSSFKNSPDTVKARFEYAKKAMEVIEAQTGYGIEWGELKENGEFRVKLSQFDFNATFEFSENGWDMLKDEAMRLKALLVEFGAKHAEIKEIDLAFDTLAVVKLKEKGKDGVSSTKKS